MWAFLFGSDITKNSFLRCDIMFMLIAFMRDFSMLLEIKYNLSIRLLSAMICIYYISYLVTIGYENKKAHHLCEAMGFG